MPVYKRSDKEDEDTSAPPLQPVDAYVDGDGRTVKVYPARYGGDCEMQPFTARPISRRGRRE